MNIHFQKIKSVLYFCMWVFFVAVAWHLWYFVFDIWSYMLPLTFGMVVGVLSGLSQPRSFLACLCGFSINALLFIFVFFNVAAGLILFGILSGLVAVAGAVLRKMLLNERTEDLYLKSWQQMLLIGGVSLLADYFTIIGTYQEFFVYHRFLTYLKSFIPVVVGLFILGLYAGLFNNVEYKAVMKSVLRTTLASHLVYLVYMGYKLFEGNITWRPFLFVPLMGLYLVLVLAGTKIGYRFRDRIKING